ncbi:unnamed protein product [Victoria cruziana]
MADEELVDPKKYLEESCKPKCVKYLLEYQGMLFVMHISPMTRGYRLAQMHELILSVLTLKNILACLKRIQGDETGHKHCTGQYFDYWRCIDNCVAPKLFKRLQ